MIITGKPELGLQPHQQEAYEAVTETYKSGNRASVVIPTGCGKSFISLQLMMDNREKRMLFLAPTEAIKSQMYMYISKYIAGEEPNEKRPAVLIAKEYFPNLKIILYPALLRMKQEVMEKLKPDIIFMDELHRTGACKWGDKIDTLLKINPDAKVLGLTATPDRMDDKNVVDELFNGNMSYELTLVDAIRKKIVDPPYYVKCDYSLSEHLNDIKTAIENYSDLKTKKELEEKYEKMRKIVERADGIPELFEKHLTRKDGKYIVFCKSKEHMDELMQIAKQWFAGVDPEPEMYSVYSADGKKKNQATIKQFEASQSEHLKLLFSVDMLNEGLHVEDISGVIMLRPTESRIIYLQQLGRALSSDTTREKTIVFDLVNNYLKNNLDAEINIDREEKGTRKTPEKGRKSEAGSPDYIHEDIDIFRIQGETKEFLDLLEETHSILDVNAYLVNIRLIENWMRDRKTTKPPSAISKDPEEKRLGKALSTMRFRLIKPYMESKTEEDRALYRKKYPELDEILEKVKKIDENNLAIYLVNIRAIEKWMTDKNTTKPPSQIAKDPEEKRLGIALCNIRQALIKPYMELKTEKEREIYREKYPELEEVMKIVNNIDANNLPIYLLNIRLIENWMKDRGTTKPPSQDSKDLEEKRLGVMLSGIRNRIINPYMKLKTEEEREKYIEKHPKLEEVMKIIDKIDENNLSSHLVNIRLIETWMKDIGTTKPPSSTSKDLEEKKLGKALSTIRQRLINPYMELETEEKREIYKEKHPELEEVMRIVDKIDENNLSGYLKNIRMIENWMKDKETTKPPSSKSKISEEKRLGKALDTVRQNLIKPYMKLVTEEERKLYRKKHPELEEVMRIVDKIDANNLPKYLVNIRLIEEWMKDRRTTKPPSSKSKDPEEKRLGTALGTIRVELIKPYIELEGEEERKVYKEKHPELDEVLEIYIKLNMQVTSTKAKKLELLIQQDLEKRKKLQQARELEKRYKAEIDKLPENQQNKQKVGSNIGE